MAIYHCSIKTIGRSAGRSAIACAAYRSGEKLYSEETDRTFDYRNKGGVVHSEITLCANAPERYLDRQTLWNSVQSVESKVDSRLAREFEVALPAECSREEHIEIGRKYAEFLADQGMIIDWSIHDKGDGNPHIHMMATTRPIDKNGKWGAKEKKIYKLDANGERVPVIDPQTGEQKIGAKGRRMWQRETVEATGWDKKETLQGWREKWAEVVNEYLTPEQYIDHRSYAERGIEQVPTVHEGYAARKIEAELQQVDTTKHSELVQKNIDIREQNELIRIIRELIQKLKETMEAIYERFTRADERNQRYANTVERCYGLDRDATEAVGEAEAYYGRAGEHHKRLGEASEGLRRFRENAGRLTKDINGYIEQAELKIKARWDELKDELILGVEFVGSAMGEGWVSDIGQPQFREDQIVFCREHNHRYMRPYRLVFDSSKEMADWLLSRESERPDLAERIESYRDPAKIEIRYENYHNNEIREVLKAVLADTAKQLGMQYSYNESESAKNSAITFTSFTKGLQPLRFDSWTAVKEYILDLAEKARGAGKPEIAEYAERRIDYDNAMQIIENMQQGIDPM